jgi:hypothetical protein
MSRISREAAKDAAEFAAAQMSYGEGAGTRRKLIESAVNYKAARIPEYAKAFDHAYFNQDMTKHVKNAKRARKAKDVGAVTSRNIKAVARGDRNSMSTPVIIAVVVATIAHQTGYDKKAWEYTKRKTSEARAWLKSNL